MTYVYLAAFYLLIIAFLYQVFRRKMKQGELIVTGKDRIEIDLGEQHPKHISVKFGPDENVPVPCNPGSVDSLIWEVRNKHEHHDHDSRHDHHHHRDQYILTICWTVSSIRTIFWESK